MQWPLPWLEALGLLAIVFAAGNGIGFALSRLSGPRTPRKTRPVPRPMAPRPVEPVPIAEGPLPKDLPPRDSPPQAPAIADLPKREAVVATPDVSPRVAFTMRVHYPVTPFGTLSVTRPNPDQPSS